MNRSTACSEWRCTFCDHHTRHLGWVFVRNRADADNDAAARALATAVLDAYYGTDGGYEITDVERTR